MRVVRRQTSKPKAPKPRFDIDDALELATALLAAPPTKSVIVRPPIPVGALVWRCVLPLEFCKPTNKLERTHWGKRARDLKRVYEFMRKQHGLRVRPEVLPGRPVVHCTRFASASIDIVSDWAKDPIDCLVKGYAKLCKGGAVRSREGLGFLVDDRQSCADIHAWWEPAPPRKGFCLIQVFASE